jgi:MFS family permease
LGGPVGGFIADTLGWRAAFLVQMPLLAISTVIFYTQVRLPEVQTLSTENNGGGAIVKGGEERTWKSKLRRIDYMGSLTLVLAVGSLLLSLSFKTSSTKTTGEDYKWSDTLIWTLLLGSATSAILFLLVEAKYAFEPILPLSLLTRRTPAFIALTNLLMPLSQFSILYNIPLFFSTVQQTSSSRAGAHLLPYSGMIGVGSLLAGWWMRRTGRYWWVLVGSAGLMVGSLAGICAWKEDMQGWLGWVVQVPGGLGYAGVLTSTLVALMADVKREGKGEK